MRELRGQSQAVWPHGQNVLTRVEVSIEPPSTPGAVLGAVREGELWPMATARAVLTRGRRIHRPRRATGPCCLVRKEVRELPPRRVLHPLSQTPGMPPPVARHLLASDQVKLLAQATAVWVRAIASSPRAACRPTRTALPPLRAFGGILLR